MKQRIRVNIFPKGGYRFVENDGTVLTDTRGWRQLSQTVSSYRRRNGYPVGNPMDEIHKQVCEANPATCFHDDEVTKQEIKQVSLKGRVLKWLSELIRFKERNPVNFVPDSEALAREDVCQKCPNNTAIKTEGCGSCKKALKELRTQVIGNKRVLTRIHGCGILGIDLPTAVYLDTEVVDNPGLPQHCWLKRR